MLNFVGEMKTSETTMMKTMKRKTMSIKIPFIIDVVHDEEYE
jgi:hypothetical protein